MFVKHYLKEANFQNVFYPKFVIFRKRERKKLYTQEENYARYRE